MKHFVIVPNAHEEMMLTIAKWHRQAEEAAFRAHLPPAPADEEIDAEPYPRLVPADDEYSAAADLGREE